MEIEAFVRKMKNIYNALLSYVESTEDFDVEYEALIEIFQKEDILQNKDEILLLFKLISKIADNHHRSPNFFDKLEKVIKYLINDQPLPISDFTNYNFTYNNRLLLILLTKGLILPDDSFLKDYLEIKTKFYSNQLFYLYPGVKQFLDEKDQKEIEKLILEKFNDEISIFEERCQIGENDSYICSLIRSDSIEEFVSYVNRTNFYLSSKIKSCIYETNSYLIKKEPTLIEYAAFYGSIQIIQYLKYNNVPLTDSLWMYGVHSNNAELIHFLEENEVKDYYSIDVLAESIKCHHNNISNYIKDNLLDPKIYQDGFIPSFSSCVYNSLNFFFFPDEIIPMISETRNIRGFNLSQVCFSLKTVTIPSSVTSIGDDAFKSCSLLKEIIIPSSVKSIGDNAFSGCLSLMKIEIPSSVTEIGIGVFVNCSSLLQIIIPSSVKSIGDNGFSGCKSLTQIEIPSSVTEIGNGAFTNCSSLLQIKIPSSVTSIANGVLSGCSSLTQIEIPSSVTKIGNGAFSGCSSLTQIEIPSSVTKIGNGAFSGCSSLTQIVIPSSVTSFGKNIFDGVKTLDIKGDIKFISNRLFLRCSSITEISIPSSVTTFEYYAFTGCSSLTQIKIPSSVTSIEDYDFTGCSSLKHVLFETPSSVTSIEYSSFKGCSSLKQILIPSSVTKIGNFAFAECLSLEQVSFESPSSLTSIGCNAFEKCKSLTQITIPSSVNSIGNNAFEANTNIIHVDQHCNN